MSRVSVVRTNRNSSFSFVFPRLVPVASIDLFQVLISTLFSFTIRVIGHFNWSRLGLKATVMLVQVISWYIKTMSLI